MVRRRRHREGRIGHHRATRPRGEHGAGPAAPGARRRRARVVATAAWRAPPRQRPRVRRPRQSAHRRPDALSRRRSKMMAALPATAPAKPAKARKVLVLGNPRGFVHSSIPLAAKTVEELGKKTGAWTSTISYDPAVFTTKNLKQYDAIFLSSTTGCFLDKTAEPPATRKTSTRGRPRSSSSCAAARASRASTRPATRITPRAPTIAGAGAGRGGGGGARRQRQRPRRHAGLGHPALVVGPQRQEASGQRHDADQSRHGSRERRDVRAARPREGRQGLPGQFHDAHRPARDAGEPVRRHGRAATTAAAAGRTGTT